MDYKKLAPAISNLHLPQSLYQPGNAFVIAIATVTFIAVFYISQFILYNFPNSADEYAYVFQAKNLAQFQTYHGIHPVNSHGENVHRYFFLVHIGETDGKYYGRFPFGYSLLMIPSAWIESLTSINTYWLTNTVFGMLSIILLYYFGARFFSKRVGIMASTMGLTSAWFLLTSGSYFSHTTNAFFVGLFLFTFCIALDKITRRDSARWLVISGFLFGFAVVIRFLDPLPYLFILLILYFGWRYGAQRRVLKDMLFFSAGGLFWAISLFYYNYSLTGDPLQTAYQYYNPHDQGTRFVFVVPDKNGSEHLDFSRIIDVGYKVMTEPNIKRLFDWHIWSWLFFLLPIAAFVRGHRFNSKLVLLSLAIAPLLIIIIYMLYGGPPMNQYGPRYYYSFFIPLTLVCAVALERTLRKSLFIVPCMLVMSYFGIEQIIRHSTDFERKLFERTNLFRTIKSANLENAVVILKTGSGSMHQVDLPRNSLDFDNSVLITQDNHGDYGALIRAYPKRTFYEYRYIGKNKLGKLTQLWVEPSGHHSRVAPVFSSNNILNNTKGLIGRYYAGKDFSQLTFQRLDRYFEFNWGFGSPHKLVANEHFSVQWEGLFVAQKSGRYTFTASSDDGFRLTLKDQVLIDNWYPHGLLTQRESIYLKKGQHKILIQYFEETFDATLKIEFKGPRIKQQVLSSEYLIPVIK